MNETKGNRKDKKNMSLSFGFLETALSQFMDSITEKEKWTKPQLVEQWNQIMGISLVAEPKKTEPKKTEPKKAEPKKEDKTVDPEKCIFKITRGEKMGEQCTSRPKAGQKFCVKHFKPDSKEEKEVEPVEKQVVVKEVGSHSEKLEKELKGKQELLEVEELHNQLMVKGTSVVINKQKIILGYWDGKKIVQEHNAETDSVQKQYHLSFAKTVRKLDE